MPTIKVKDRVISFSGAIIFLVSIIMLIITDGVIFSSVGDKIKAIFFISMYVIFALMSDDLNNLMDIIEHAWYVLKKDDDDRIKITLIKSAVDLYMQRWLYIWELLQKKDRFKALKEKALQLLKRIPSGCITYAQIIWILSFTGYTFASNSILLSSALAPLDIWLIPAFYVVLALTSGKMKGMGDLIKKIYNDLELSNDNTATHCLREIENSIMAMMGSYYLTQEKSKKPIEE